MICKCEWCGNQFENQKKKRFCSYECSYHYANKLREEDNAAKREDRYAAIAKKVAAYGEHIKPIPGHEKYYITDSGTVYSTHRGYWKEKAQHVNRDKYMYVALEDKPFKVHQLVLIAFGYDKPEGMQVRHLNGNSKDNRLVNLCWGTCLENAHDRELHGTKLIGENHPTSKHNDASVLAAIQRVRKGESIYAVARDYGMSAASISRWNNGKSRWHKQLQA